MRMMSGDTYIRVNVLNLRLREAAGGQLAPTGTPS